MKRLPEGYFPWVHVMARITHSVPAPISAGFLPTREMRTAEAQVAFIHGPTYTPELQPKWTRSACAMTNSWPMPTALSSISYPDCKRRANWRLQP